MWFEKRVCLLDIVAVHYFSTCIYDVTGQWALWWEGLTFQLHWTNRSCPQSDVCRTKGRRRERVNCLSCAGRYQPNRRRCLPLRAEMMMIMWVCVCLWGWIMVSGDKFVFAHFCVHTTFLHFCVCFCESVSVWQSERSSGQVDESWGTYLGNVHIREIVQVKS